MVIVRSIFILPCFLLSAFLLNAQNKRIIDSLKSVLSGQTGKDRFETLDDLTYEHIDVDNERALRYARSLYTLAFELQDSFKIVLAGARMGFVLRRLERIDSAILVYSMILPVARRHNFKQEVKYITNGLGSIYAFRAHYDKALGYFFESLALRRESESMDEISIVLNNIALVHYKMKSYEKALQYFEESLRIKRKIKDYYEYDNVLINSGLSHVFLGHYQESIKIFHEGITFFGDSTQWSVKAMGYYGLGVAYFGMRNLKEARRYFNSSFALSMKFNDHRYQADNLVYLGKISFALKNWQDGIDQLLEAERLSQQYGYNELLITAYEELIKMFTSMHNTKQLSIYQAKYIQLREHLYGASLIENLAMLEAKLKAQENVTLLKSQQEARIVNAQLVIQQRILIFSILTIAILLSILLFLLYRASLTSKCLNGELEAKVAVRTDELVVFIKRLKEMQDKQSRSIENIHKVVLSHIQTLKGLNIIMGIEVYWKQQLNSTLEKLNQTVLGRFLTDKSAA